MLSCKYDLSLLELIWRQRWTSVERRVSRYPHELDLEHQGLTALHWACCNDLPVNTLRILLSKDFRRHALERDQDGMTPLLLLLSCSTTVDLESIEIFCHYAPDCLSISDYTGQTALHYFCLLWGCPLRQQNRSERNFQIFSKMLEMDQTLATRVSTEGETALDKLWLSFSLRVNNNNFQTCWEATKSIICVACPERKGGTFLHQLVSYANCRAVILEFAMDRYSAVLETTDSLGNTILHRAVIRQQNSSILSELLGSGNSLILKKNLEGKTAIELAPCWRFEIETIIKSCPEILSLTHITEKHYPYILSNIFLHETMFTLLRKNPALCSFNKISSVQYTFKKVR